MRDHRALWVAQPEPLQVDLLRGAGDGGGAVDRGAHAAANADVPFGTLIVDMRASFGKKATGTVTFTCEDGAAVFAAVQEARATGEARTVTLETVGRLDDGVEASRFTFTWSVKARKPG